MADHTPLILFSGMGADERVFAPQREAFPNLVVPPWIAPLPSETLALYAARFATKIDPGRPCFIGGASFGGMVAVEVTRHLRGVLGCFLIGSVRSPLELPRRLRALRPAVRHSHRLPFGWLPPAARCVSPWFEWFSRGAACGMVHQVADSDPEFLRWACGAVLNWEAAESDPPCPIHQIHGARDPILPWRLTRPDVLVRGGGHVLTLSNPQVVNAFIRDRFSACAR
jgi:pimeloyl-ACP methyl ester carboxylesterase